MTTAAPATGHRDDEPAMSLLRAASVPAAEIAAPLVQRALAPILVAGVVVGLAAFPLANGVLALAFAAYALALARVPWLWLVAVPAALPALDLARFSGWFLIDPFDGVLAVTLAVLLWRQPLARRDFALGRALAIALAALALSYGVSALRGLLLDGGDGIDGFVDAASPLRALALLKGFVWAAALTPFLARAVATDRVAVERFAAGMLLGLVGVGTAAVIERYQFPGLANFELPFRVTATFSSMHHGGQHIDGYIVAALPFIAVVFFAPRRPVAYLAAAAVFALGVYTLLVTFSRGPYIGGLIAFLVLAGGLLVARRRPSALGLGVAAALAAIVAVLTPPVFEATFAERRFEAAKVDLDKRIEHWRTVLAIRDRDLATVLFGMGLGSFPRVYAARVGAPTRFTVAAEGGNRFLRILSGEPIPLGQRVAARPGRPYRLSFDARSPSGDVALVVALCERSLLYEFRCRMGEGAELPAGGPWRRQTIPLATGEVGAPLGRHGFFFSRRPVELMLMLWRRQPGLALDIDNLSLTDGASELLANGDFAHGLDRWYATSRDHLPWHVKNMALHLFFEQGALGVAAVFFAVAAAVIALGRRLRTGDRMAAVLLAALTGFVLVGAVGSLLDAPRLAVLFYLLIGLALAPQGRGKVTVTEAPGGGASERTASPCSTAAVTGAAPATVAETLPPASPAT